MSANSKGFSGGEGRTMEEYYNIAISTTDVFVQKSISFN